MADDRNAVFEIEYRLRVAADIHNVVEWLIHELKRLRVKHGQRSRDIRDGTQRAEVESADVKIAAGEKPFIERHTQIRETLNVGSHGPHGENVPAVVHRPVKSEIDARPVEVDIAAQKAAGELERACEAVPARWIVRVVYRAVGK